LTIEWIALPSLKHRSILIVADNNDDRTLLIKALQAAAVENPLLVADNAQFAQDLLWQAADQVDIYPCLVLLDLSGSAEVGLVLLRAMRADARTRRIPVIVMSDGTHPQALMDHYESGANSCIVKNGNRDAFYDKISCLCMYWLNICQLPC
jgi:two-component system response regulator